MGVGSGGGPAPPGFYTWDKNSRERLKSAIFRCFFAIFLVFFPLPPIEEAQLCYFSDFFAIFWSFFPLLPPPLEIFPVDALGRRLWGRISTLFAVI